MKFVLKDDEGLEKLILRLKEANRSLKRIAERDMLLSLLLINLEEKSNYFSLCKAVSISPYGGVSRKILLNSINGKDFKKSLENQMNILSKYKKNNRTNSKKERLYTAISALVKFMKKIKKSNVHELAYLKEGKISLTKKEEERVSKILEILQGKDEKISRIVGDAIILYYNGLKEEDNAFSFLRFWIVVEMLVKSGGKLSNEDILKRVSKIYNQELYGSLRLLYKKRNRIVHSYVFVSQDERNLMKSIAETIIFFVLYRLKDVSTLEELRGIFVKKEG